MFLFIKFNRGYALDCTIMRMHSMCANSSILRIFHYSNRIKWTSSQNKIFLLNNKALQRFHEPVTRIICTDSNIQSSYEVQEVEKEHYIQDYFLKENFNIVDSRYFKLITLPNECNNLEELLWTNEFKNVLSKSTFLYDVNVIENANISHSHVCTIHPNSCEALSYTCENYLMHKLPVYECSKVLCHSSKTNATGKPTEEQLLLIIDRLKYSLINFFEKPQDYSIYHKNIVFQNNIKRVTIKGLKAYIQSMYLMKFYGYIHFVKVRVEILKITHHIEDGSIRVRWRINGMPRHKMLILLWNYKQFDWRKLPKEETDWLDGFSVFSVGDDGLIYRHVCDKMIPDDDMLLAKKVDLKSKVLGLLGLAPRGPATGTLNTLIPCYKNQALISCKKLT